MKQFTIKDLEQLSGIKAHTIRIWERRYNIIKPFRTDTNRRRYSGADLRRIINVAILNGSGLKISKIAAMTDDQINSRVAAIMISGDMTASEIESLILAMTALDRKSVAGILDRSAALRGLEATYTDVVFPFMKRVGLMWQTETISPGYEHFVTGIFRNILIKAIETMEPVKATRPRRILLYLPENEMHELPLLLFTYIAAMEGNEVIYLGQMTPLTSVIEISESWNPDIIVTGAATALPPDPVRYLQQLMAALPGTRIVTGGTFVTIPGIKRIKCVTPVRTSGEFRKFLSGLKD